MKNPIPTLYRLPKPHPTPHKLLADNRCAANFQTCVMEELGECFHQFPVIEVPQGGDGGGADDRLLGALGDLQDQLGLSGPPLLR